MASLTPQAAASTVRLRDLRTTLDGVYLTLHVAAMGFTLVLPLLGAAWSPIDVGWRGLLWRVALGLSFHVFAYALNDVCDLPIDRTEPGRARDPLVRGVISVRTVTFLALGQLPVLAWLWAARGAPVRTGAAIGVAVAALAAYDRYSRTSRRASVGPPCCWRACLTSRRSAVGWRWRARR
jgi:4-hydroxybenzoate polyprenyltransferase